MSNRNSNWYNADQLTVGYGTREAQDYSGAVTVTAGEEQEIVYNYSDLTELLTAATADSGIYGAGRWTNSPLIPAGATITSVTVKTDVAATSGGAADLLVGLYTIAPTTGLLVVVDTDGLVAAGDSQLTDFSVAGETISGAGAYVNAKTVGSADVVVAPIYATAVYTAGALTVTVKYTQARKRELDEL
jgi:hypothetical protein